MSTRKSSGIVKNQALTKPNRVIKLLKRAGIFLAILIIVAALISSLFRALTPFATQYKSDLEHHLSAALGAKVSINTMETGWYWFEPVIKLNQVTLTDAGQGRVKLKQLLVGIDLFSSLWHWQLQPGVLYIDGLSLTARQSDDHWRIEGLAKNETHQLSMEKASYTPILAWILAQQKIIVKRVALKVYLQDGTVIPIRKLNLLIARNGASYRMKAKVALEQTIPTSLKALAMLTINPYKLEDTQGQIYLEFDNLLPRQWQGFYQARDYQVLDGKTSFKAWLDVASGQLTKVQGDVHVQDLVWRGIKSDKKQKLKALDANVVWKGNKEGWRLATNDLEMIFNGQFWPKNSLVIQFQQQAQQWSLYTKSLMIDALLSLDIPWPESVASLKAMKFKGQLQNTQIHLKEKAITSVLTQFENLSWKASDKYPGVRNLSGVLQWQPAGGQLAIDSEQMSLEPKKKPKLTFQAFNASFDWQAQGQGYRLHMGHLVLRHPNLLLQADGVVHDLQKDKAGSMALKAKFSATEAQQWMTYLPGHRLKPKLEAWLKQDIKRINKVVGDVTLNGLVSDFPFDQKPGTFEINTHLSGVDLIFAPGWPLTKDIEAYLQVNKRALNADIVYANMQGVIPEQINLSIHDIGLDKEVLLLHGKVATSGTKALNYVLSTPLNKKLSELKQLKIQGPLGLDLQLEVPLYPENDEILALGDLIFEKNEVTISHALTDIQLQGLKGSLQFDQNGVLDSRLKASLYQHPANLHIESFSGKNPRTEVNIKTGSNIKVLSEKFNLPLTSFMRGNLNLDCLLSLSSLANGSDTFSIKSNLKEVNIDLPEPLGKKQGVVSPLKIVMELPSKKPLVLQAHYDHLVVKATQFSTKEWRIYLKQGEMEANLQLKMADRLLSGVFNKVKINKIKPQAKTLTAAIKAKDMPNLNLEIRDFHYDGIDVGRIVLKAKSTKDAWLLEGSELESPDYKATLNGRWQQDAKVNQSQISFLLHINDLAKSLERWHISPVVEASKGDVLLEGRWPGSFIDFSLGKMKGKMVLEFKDGHITHLSQETEEKLGLGKLLSVLSLQTIPRRLKLDFSDLSHPGYSFDRFKGNFDIMNGVMTTNDSAIDGPVAYASMKGQLDIVNQLYNLDLSISPHITASLPIVATIAGGPIAGIATWAASKIINKGMQKISAYTYKITGPWKNPEVKQVSIFKKQE